MAKVILEHVDKIYPGNVKAVDDFNVRRIIQHFRKLVLGLREPAETQAIRLAA